ncbi:MAG: hypothetical protein IPO85_12430 [Saprospiraceae bacterium]|uniref:Uncharacterized protein n=1 Tax=Candidatus Defluviibacterium haderslevense TaxID=2981993 RepID=A0A9D7S982_9BACT|nr:hypothetical protein [Candidatus Defluviibacterium haderslevense]
MSTAVKSNKKLTIDYNFVIKGVFVLGGLYFGYKIINSLFKAVGLAPDKDQIKKDVDLNQSIQDTNFVLSSALIQDLQSKDFGTKTLNIILLRNYQMIFGMHGLLVSLMKNITYNIFTAEISITSFCFIWLV